MTTLEEYLRRDLARNVIDHAIRVVEHGDRSIGFYIHPAAVGGNTTDFIVKGNQLELRFEA